MNETSVTVVGNIASQLTVRHVGQAGEHLRVGFRVASSERRRDRVSGEWVDGERFSAWVTCWRRLGEHVSISLAKGDAVVVHGRLSVREYEVGGERRYSTEIAATSVGPDLARCAAQVRRQRPGAEAADHGASLAPGTHAASPAPGDEVPVGPSPVSLGALVDLDALAPAVTGADVTTPGDPGDPGDPGEDSGVDATGDGHDPVPAVA